MTFVKTISLPLFREIIVMPRGEVGDAVGEKIGLNLDFLPQEGKLGMYIHGAGD